MLNSSTCSEILSQKWAFLDNISISSQNDSSKAREAHWKELEEALFEWKQRYEAGNNPLTGAMLREKAQEFWRELPCYQGLPAPKLSEGWITRFKHRHNIRRFKHRSNKVEAIPKVSIQEALSALRTLKTYEEQQGSGDPALTKALRQRERQLDLSRSTTLRQGRTHD